jgi:Fe-S cluster assembly scaffold protein SufB
MNKIIIVNDEIKEKTVDDNIKLELLEKNILFDVNSLKFKVLKDTSLIIEYDSTEKTKLDLFFDVDKDVNFNIYEIRKGIETKVQYKYYLQANSNTNVFKFYYGDRIRELDIINLNGIDAKINYNFKTISSKHQKYDMMIYHNYKNTYSNIYNRGLNIEDGELVFNVTSIVDNGKVDCVINQNNRIINMNNRKCKINPNLLIEENDVEANHSALIGKFSDEELFYLQSRGITKEDAQALLVKGFLLSGLEGEFKEIVENIIDNRR